jgi:2-dehydropantoate 2-reductase
VKICVVGAGGLGGFFGGWLASSGEQVTFVARGEHLATMRSKGLEIRSELGNKRLSRVSAVDDPQSIGVVDVLMFTVKSYDLREAAAKCHSLVGPDTLLVSLLNGIGWVEELKEIFPCGHLAAGVTMVPSNIVSPGVIEHKGVGTAITLGAFDAASVGPLKALRDAFTNAGIDAQIDDDIEMRLWTKFVAWSAGAGVTSLSRQPYGVVRNDPALKHMFVAAMTEAAAVARATGIGLADNLFSELMKVLETMPPASKSSMLVDLENGKRLELAAGAGTVVRLGRQLGIDTPVCATINAALGPFVDGR